MQHWRTSKSLQLRARQLRREMTPAEIKLWRYLRLGQPGAHFRRQHAVGPYVLDFFCARQKLVIEVDGDSHGDPRQIEADAKRTRWLREQKDYRVLRFCNAEVLNNIEGVLIRIAEALGGGPPP